MTITTTTTCDGCSKMMLIDGGPPYLVLTEWVPGRPLDTRNAVKQRFCSRSCLAEYLKPKTEATP